MRSPGDILLLSCYELGHQPLHLATLAALLRRAGYAPTIVDTAVDALADEAIVEARFVAIAVPMHTALRLGEQLARRIRSLNPLAHICFYGLYAALNEDFLLQDLIDSAIGGEYEQPLLELITALEQARQSSLPVIPGVSTRQQLSRPSIERAPLVMPDRAGLPPLERYARLEWSGQARIAGYAEATRGCKHTCLHCPITPIYRGRFFAVPASIVLADIHAQVRQGAQHITFGDPDFLNGPTHALRITRALHQEFPGVTFDATIKIEHLLQHRRLLPELKANGCLFVVSAVESLNDEVLARLDKGHSAEGVAEVFDLMEQAGIALRPSLMPFSPWETLESYISLLDFIERRHLVENVDPVHLSIRLLIPPGSALLSAPGTQMWLQELDAAAYTYRWRHPDPRMDTLHGRVSALVEEAQRKGADPIEIFFHIKALALAAQGQDMCVSCGISSYGARKVVPHLTESWFC
jgi:radical SAM superfamily enzyme YgiQ (UPF0313 family)